MGGGGRLEWGDWRGEAIKHHNVCYSRAVMNPNKEHNFRNHPTSPALSPKRPNSIHFGLSIVPI